MKQLILILLCTMLGAEYLHSNTTDTSEVVEKIEHRINEVITRSYFVNDTTLAYSDLDINWSKSKDEYYNKKNQLVRSKLYDTYGEMTFVKIPKYKKNGDVKQVIYIDKEERVMNKWLYKFSPSNKQLVTTKYWFSYLLNDTKKTVRDKDKWSYKEDIKHDSLGNEIRKSIIYKEGGNVYDFIMFYDEFGNMVRRQSVLPLGKVLYTELYTYDMYSRQLTMKSFNDKKQLTNKHYYYYNSNGEIAKEEFSYTRTKKDGELRYEYEYDHQNNWIKRVLYKNDKAQSITTRTISYHLVPVRKKKKSLDYEF